MPGPDTKLALSSPRVPLNMVIDGAIARFAGAPGRSIAIRGFVQEVHLFGGRHTEAQP